MYFLDKLFLILGKGESIWDRLTHEHPNLVDDQTTGDVACDSYNKIADDVQILKDLGINFYRFSLSWSRILPTGQTNFINPDGIRYYNELIDQLLANGIEPYVTMYHWDLPQPMQELGGWPNPLLAQYFEDYADVVYKSFGDRVKFWITFNEPIEVCKGYGEGSGAPGYFQNGVGDYLCGKTILLAHARAYHLYYERYQAQQNGVVGITISTAWNEPNSDDPADVEAAERKMLFECGWFTHPIFSETGDYPPIMTERVADISAAQNYSRSRLPPLTPEEIAYIKGTSDFLGLNHYTTWLVRQFEYDVSEPPTFWKDSGTAFEQDPTWESSDAGWLKVVPWGFRNLLKWLKNTYNNPILYVTENGFADTGDLDDQRRVNYYLVSGIFWSRAFNIGYILIFGAYCSCILMLYWTPSILMDVT